jgi:hypothetical protein
MTKRFLVPVAYWIAESGSQGAWPEVIQVSAENEHDALMKTREALIERDKEEDGPDGKPAVWHKDAIQYQGHGKWVTDNTYGEPDEEGYIMGDPRCIEQMDKDYLGGKL